MKKLNFLVLTLLVLSISFSIQAQNKPEIESERDTRGAILECDGNSVLDAFLMDYTVKNFPDGSYLKTGQGPAGSTDDGTGIAWTAVRSYKERLKGGAKTVMIKDTWTSEYGQTYRNQHSYTIKDGLLIKESRTTCK